MPTMQVVYGAYQCVAGACRFGVRQTAVLDAREFPYMYEMQIDVSGRFYAAGDALLSVEEARMRAALRLQRQDFGVLGTTGTATATYWRNADTVSGIVVRDGPNFTGTTAAEYCLYREFSFTVAFKLPIANVASALVEFSETVEYSGGEPEYVHKRAMNGPPQKQLVWFQTEFRAVQSGKAVGFRAYPNPARMLFPGDRKTAPTYTRGNPKRLGDGYINYPLTWSYSYESNSPLVGIPNVWL